MPAVARLRRVKVVVAPDKFRGTLGAKEAAAAIAAGWRRSRPDWRVEQVPLADGGDGTLDVLLDVLGGEPRTATVTGPLGRPVEADYGLVARPDGDLAIVEMARASGLALVPRHRRDPKVTTTRGTGELMLAACRAGARRVIVCAGGSATSDGGAGMAQALGFGLRDAAGREIAPGGAALLDLDRIDAGHLDAAVRGVEVTVATDVDNPLTGPNGAAATYGPQKGAGPDEVALLDRSLARFGEVVERDLGVEIAGVPGAGAAGGLAGGLIAFLGARLVPGVRVVMDAVGFERRLAGADFVVTGEGRFDAQSLHGKVPGAVLAAARARRLPVAILCGRSAAPAPQGVQVRSLARRFGMRRAMSAPREGLEDLAAAVAAGVREPHTRGGA